MVVDTAVIAREPVGVVAGDRPVERAVRDHGQQGVLRAGRGLHDRDEAVARRPRSRPTSSPRRPRPPACRRAWSTSSRGDREASEHLVSNPGIDKVSFTGSTAAGKRIAEVCGGRIARCTLELGGKSAAIVLDDFPIEAAAGIARQHDHLMSGQVCAMLSRAIVPQAPARRVRRGASRA